MARARRRYVCENCGATQARWMGRCPECGEWNTLVEALVPEPAPSASQRRRPLVATPSGEVRSLTDITGTGGERLAVPMGELSRVLGGGIVPGSGVLIGGDPGIGKSTLLLQMASLMCNQGRRALYVSGEESLHQIKLRADRLGIHTPNLLVLAETNLEQILAQIEATRPILAVVDSIQSVYSEAIASSPGSVTQVRECAGALLRLAKARNIPTFLVGHVTKSGNIAGPMLLEHMVDTVLYLEGERYHSYRLLRSVKNRFGSTNEVGVFEMTDRGMVEVPNPSQVFLEERIERATGSAVAVTMEGTRPILVEIQALVSRGNPERPRRNSNGIDFNRLLLLSAVLSKRVGLRLGDQDIFVNVVGGLRVEEPAVDLAVAVAIASSYYNRPVHADMAIFGEVGLAGELRSVRDGGRRLREAAKLGFRRVLVPVARGGTPLGGEDIQTIGVRFLAQAVRAALQPGDGAASPEQA